MLIPDLDVWNGNIALHFQIGCEMLILDRNSVAKKIELLNYNTCTEKTSARGYITFPSPLVGVSFIGVRKYIPSEIYLSIHRNNEPLPYGDSNFHISTGGDQISDLEIRPLLCFEEPITQEHTCCLVTKDGLSGHKLEMRIRPCNVKDNQKQEMEIIFS